MVAEFDYSRLDEAFEKMSKPAKRALINNKIFKPKDLARYSLKEVLKLHGVGPSSAPILKKYTKG